MTIFFHILLILVVEPDIFHILYRKLPLMKAFSHINIGKKISFIIGCKNYLILVKKRIYLVQIAQDLVHSAQVLISLKHL